ncbi:Hypothetical predicted protein [Paramuricea clavata]|uniref:Uncharacterized protein n=1 Tax=Paramuricea clavata TaxID=317549 RepID=A0A7D9I1S0_PARCT|nr:Hypothetical predicted protein [Paramuricea clavata]
MAAVLSPLGNDLEITPSVDVLKQLFRKQVILFEKKLMRKIIDNNFFRVTSDKPMEKCVVVDEFRLVFMKSLADRFKTSERVYGLPVCFVFDTLDRMMELYSAKTLVRRFRTGDFAVILPFFVVACDIDIITQETLFTGQLVFAIEKAGDCFKCLIPFGGTDPNAEDQTAIPKGYVNTYIETSKERLWFPSYKGEGALIVEKGFNFVYSPCNVIKPDSVIVLREKEYEVISVVNDTFNSTRDLVRLNYAPDFNSKHCAYQVKRPVEILARCLDIPCDKIIGIRKMKLIYKEGKTSTYGRIELRFWNAAFNKMGILTQDIAIPAAEVEALR